MHFSKHIFISQRSSKTCFDEKSVSVAYLILNSNVWEKTFKASIVKLNLKLNYQNTSNIMWF